MFPIRWGTDFWSYIMASNLICGLHCCNRNTLLIKDINTWPIMRTFMDVKFQLYKICPVEAYMCIYLFFPFWFLLQCHLNENLKKPNPQIRWRLTTPGCQRRTASGREGNVSQVTNVNRTRPSWPRARSRALCAARPLPSAVRWGMTSWALMLSPSNHELVCFSLLSLFPTLPLSLLRLYYPS